MSDEKQHEQDQAKVQTQLGVTDITRIVAKVPSFFGFGGGSGPGPFASTSFENHELNAMIDLVENANPADMESAGAALWKTRDALKEAARELSAYVDKVEWKGESGTAFRTFGTALAAHATDLAGFADVAGTQITVAGEGLASVRKSMPSRDGRFSRKDVDDIPMPARIEGNPEYVAAVKVEKNRQEAINQMYRLASYYAVSEERLAGQEVPKFEKKLNADVPRPTGKILDGSGTGSAARTADSSGLATPRSVGHAEMSGTGMSRAEADGLVTPVPERATIADSGSYGTGGGSRGEAAGLAQPVLDRNAVEINSVATPSAPTTGPSGTPAPSAAGTTVPSSGFTPPAAAGFVNPVQGGAPRSVGGTGVPKAVGRPGMAAGGTGDGTAGRPGIGGGSTAAGRAGGAGQPVAGGRSGAAGHPMAGRAGTGGVVGPRAGRVDGVVGGKPRATGGSTGSRLPRGTVIGGEGIAAGRASAGKPSQSGVVGANPAKSTNRPGARGTASSNGVVGKPRGGTSGSRSGVGGFTQGGAGLVRGPGGKKRDEREEQDTRSRPDYLTEDEETWTARRRGPVPPVIE
ncbi:hypothetical protein [Streptomyces sp. NPDC088554]|uniref:hypothetical protein n=1 Tax=Streptomyces sp. NPDC088554 TaxID=3365865 RepID=UPI0037F9CD19